MATKPYFLWGDTHAASASDSDAAAVYASRAPETAALLAAATAAGDTAAVAPELGAVSVARPRMMRRNPSASGKQQQQPQQAGGGGAKKPPQRGLGVAELERLRCGGDPLRELLVDAAGAKGHPLLQYHHLQVPPPAFDSAAGGRYCSQLLAPPPGPPPVCFLHTPSAEQQYFRDRWGRMGGFPPAGNGSGCGSDHQPQLLPPAPEHPSSQNTIWRPVASSPSSSCLHTGHRCDICCRRMRALAEREALAPTPPPASPNTAGSNTVTDATPDYSIYDLAAAMAAGRQGDTFLALERKGGAPAAAEAPAKKEVREIEFFPAASAHHTGSGGGGGSWASVRGDSELAAPFASPYGAGGGGRTAPQLDLSLRL